jgi:hypothetical protein
MTPEDFTADLSDRLHRDGVVFNCAHLEAFAADVRRESPADPDIEALARRFRESQAAALKRKRASELFQEICVVGIGIVCLGFVALAGMACLLAPANAESVWAAVTIIGGGGCVLALTLAAVGAILHILGMNRRAEEAK